jgi:hypothetical protein
MAQAVIMCTASGEQHGLINTLTNSVPFDDFKAMKPENKETCRKMKIDDAKKVKVKYLNTRGKHERLDKPYCKYAGDPILQYHLIPGYEYELPMGMVKEVNAVKMPRRSGLQTIDGAPLNKDESPLDKDQEGEQLHMLVPAAFA